LSTLSTTFFSSLPFSSFLHVFSLHSYNNYDYFVTNILGPWYGAANLCKYFSYVSKDSSTIFAHNRCNIQWHYLFFVCLFVFCFKIVKIVSRWNWTGWTTRQCHKDSCLTIKKIPQNIKSAGLDEIIYVKS